jgi:adenylate kinase family enzyme
MRIHIIGNIASGKSFLARKLSEKTGFPVFCIDDFRISTNNLADISGEKLAWMTFENAVMSQEKCISESTGVSYHWIPMVTLAPGIIIKVATSWKECLANHKTRVKSDDYQAPPMPYKFKLKESLQRNEYLLSKINADVEFHADRESDFWPVVLNLLEY